MSDFPERKIKKLRGGRMGMCSLNPLKVARARGEGLAALWGAAEIAGDTGL